MYYPGNVLNNTLFIILSWGKYLMNFVWKRLKLNFLTKDQMGVPVETCLLFVTDLSP